MKQHKYIWECEYKNCRNLRIGCVQGSLNDSDSRYCREHQQLMDDFSEWKRNNAELSEMHTDKGWKLFIRQRAK